jgi:hypothetical protein
MLDVYELLPGGLIKKVNGWPVGTTGLELMAETQVCTVSPDVTTLETRDALSGKLTNLRKLPAGVDRVNPSFEWGKGCLLETRSDAHGKIYQIIYDIESGRPIRTPKLTLQQWVRFDSDGLWLLVGETAQGSYAQVYDSRQHETLWEQTLGPRALGTFLDSSHIGLADHRNAITTQVVDFRNGRVIAFSQPWWWAAPLVVICGLGFAAWALLWVRSAPPGSRWGWSDLLILIMLPLVMLVTRLLSGGDRLDVNRLVMAYIQGIFIAACHLCGVWIVFGRGTRWPLRCVPFILVIAGLMCLLSYVFRSPERESLFTMIFPTMNWAWEGLATTLIPSLISMVGWLGLSRWKFSLVGEGFASEQKPARSTQWPLRDFFVAITCAAVLVACIRPFLSQLPNRVPSIPLDLIVCAAMAILAHVGLCGLAFSKRSAWLAWGTAIMVVLAISIVTLPAIDFAQHQRLAPLTERGRKFFLVSAVSLVWFYGCLLAMRYQYRLRWTMRPKPPPRVPVSFTTPAPPTNSGSLHSSHCAKQLDVALKQQSSSS